MNVLLLMIPLSLVLLIGAVIAFFWAVDNDQFDDMHTPALLPLSEQPPSDRLEAEATPRDAPTHASRLHEQLGP